MNYLIIKAISTKVLTKCFINKFSILNRAKYFYQLYLLFLPAKRYIKCFSGTTRIDSMKSNEMLAENIDNITRAGSNFVYHHILPNININGHILIKNDIPIS